jgi:hypothetical protein
MIELAVLVAIVMSGEFDATDPGIGGRIGWQATPLAGVEAEITHYPSGLADAPVFSRGRFEGLAGATVGPRIGRFRYFGRVRPGFLRVQPAPGPIVCIAIFPPPLTCELAGGRTLFVMDLGGGVDVSIGERTFLRLDGGDRLVRYPGPVFDSDRTIHEDAFFGHDFRVTVAGGIRF